MTKTQVFTVGNLVIAHGEPYHVEGVGLPGWQWMGDEDKDAIGKVLENGDVAIYVFKAETKKVDGFVSRDKVNGWPVMVKALPGEAPMIRAEVSVISLVGIPSGSGDYAVLEFMIEALTSISKVTKLLENYM